MSKQTQLQASEGHLGRRVIVDYCGITKELQKALALFDEQDIKGVLEPFDKEIEELKDPTSNGGSVSDKSSLTYDLSRHSYDMSLSLDEFGCTDCG